MRNYRLYFFGEAVSMTGSWIHTVGIGWLVLDLTDSGTALGVVTALEFLPMLLAGPWGGLIADRFDKRRTLLIANTTMVGLAGVLAVVTLTGAVRLWMVYVLALLTGVVQLVDNPTSAAFVAELVGDEDVENATALNAATFNLARAIGPAAAGLLIVSVGSWACFAFDAASFAASGVGLLAMSQSDLRRSEPIARARGQLRDGLRYVWQQTELRLTILLMTVVGTLGFNFTVILPLLARHTFHGGARAYGLMTSAMGLGSLFGALFVAGRLRPARRPLLVAGLAFGATTAVAAAAPGLGWALPAFVVVGSTATMVAVSANVTLQRGSDPEMRGRVMALYGVVFLGTFAVGGPLLGWFCQRFGARSGLALGAVATLIATLAFGSGRGRAAESSDGRGLPAETTVADR